ncbi:MAG TPA: septum formation initiator family protein [Ignavibacteriaceae bacterium]|nr:septum formation initiator family protein [Ignavibacteriaceae bacterium]
MSIIGVIFLAGIIFLLFNEYGIVKYIRLNNQVNELNKQINEVEQQNKRLQAEIDSLENKVPAKIEEVAREKYNMIRPGESKIVVEDK